MSNPITRVSPAACAVRAIPTMPPAGPDRIASLPRKWCASVRPPEERMNWHFTPGSALLTWST